MKSDYYLKFENKFRGNRESIIDGFSIYDSLIDSLIDKNLLIKSLDIGCGRGEWLEKWSAKIPDAIGIENDDYMIKTCQEKGLNVIQGDAINILKTLPIGSVSLITIFHVVEHLSYDKLIELISLCYQVLNDRGVLLIETPSIDNLVVSSKSFFLDPTHINHINPDGLAFAIENIGFDAVKTYYIHGGPLKNDEHLKLTRILNGVAQDVMFLATKKAQTSDIIFRDFNVWESKLELAPTTLEAAVDYDLEYQKRAKDNLQTINSLNIELINLKNEITFLNDKLKKLFYLINIFKFFLRPMINKLLFIRKIGLKLLHKTFNFLIKFIFFRRLFLSKVFLYLVNLIIKKIFLKSSTITITHMKEKINKNIEQDMISSKFNQKLFIHHKNSLKSREYSLVLKKEKPE